MTAKRSILPDDIFPIIHAIQIPEVPALPLDKTYVTYDDKEIDSSILDSRMIGKKGVSLSGETVSEGDQVSHAFNVVSTLVDKNFLDEVQNKVDEFALSNKGKTNIYIPTFEKVGVNKQKGGRTNRLADIFMATVLKHLTNAFKNSKAVSIEKSPVIQLLPQYTKDNQLMQRTNSGLMERVVNQREVSVPEIPSNGGYFLIDDHVQYGGMMYSALSEMIKNGSKIAGLAAMSVVPESQSLKISTSMKNAFTDAFDREDLGKLAGTLSRIGLSFDTLSNRDAATILSFVTDKESFPQFEKVCEANRISMDMREASGETIREQYKKARISLDTFDEIVKGYVDDRTINTVKPSKKSAIISI